MPLRGAKVVAVAFVMAAGTLAFGAALSVLADCPNMEPQKHPTISWGSNVKCGDPPEQCGQNYSITNNWACDLPSDDHRCVPGEVVLVEVHQFRCPCAETVTEIKGAGPTAQVCPP